MLNNEDFWSKVIFSDEKVFQSCNDGHIRVYRPRGQRYNQNFTFDPIKSGRFSVNTWAWISQRGMGMYWFIDGHLNSTKYIEILENVMLPSVRELYPDDNFIFQQDNCSIHTARNTKQWLRDNNVEELPWPSKSPDINPIENVWGIMVKHIRKLNYRPQNAEQLRAMIEDEWESLCNTQIAENLVLSMPRRLQAILDGDGAMTKY